jgi:hypothetical protein
MTHAALYYLYPIPFTVCRCAVYQDCSTAPVAMFQWRRFQFFEKELLMEEDGKDEMRVWKVIKRQIEGKEKEEVRWWVRCAVLSARRQVADPAHHPWWLSVLFLLCTGVASDLQHVGSRSFDLWRRQRCHSHIQSRLC